MANLSILRNNSNKKTYGVASAKFDFTEAPTATGHLLFKLPPGVVITDVDIVIHEDGPAGSTADIKVVDGLPGGIDVEIFSDASLEVAGGSVKHQPVRLYYEGMHDISFTPSVALTSGSFTVAINYFEPALSTGKITNYSP